MPRLTRIAGPALLVVVAFAALIVALLFGGGAAAEALADPGPVVRYGLPIARLVVDLSAAVTLGTLALAVFALTPDRPEQGRALDIASASAALWTIASAVTGFFTFLSVSNVEVTADQKFGETLAFFLTGTALGLAWLVSTLIAAVVTVLCFAVRGTTTVFFTALVAGAGLVPLAQQGHAAGTSGHDLAVTALGLHIVGAAVWLGGLVAIVLLRPVVDRARVGIVLSRYSTLALLCFVIVGVSGVASAEIRLGSWSALGTHYGVLVIVKVVALIVLGLFGVVHRRVLVGRMQNAVGARQRPFWSFVGAELAFLGLASGVAAALARTEAPVTAAVLSQTGAVSPAEVLTDQKLPAAPGPLSWLTAWNFDLVWLLAAAFLLAFYVGGVVRLRRRGESWSMWRVVSWCAGLLALTWATSGAPNVYEKYTMGAHLVVVVIALVVVPALLVAAAPFTLAFAAIEKRTDGSRGPREWLLLVVRSRAALWLTHPLVALLLPALTVWSFVEGPLLRWSVTTLLGHTVLLLVLVLTGWLWCAALVGRDPARQKVSWGLRIALAGAGVVGVAGLGAALAFGRGLLLANWYGAMGRIWGAAPLDDQRHGGLVSAAVGVVVCLVLGAATARRRAG